MQIVTPYQQVLTFGHNLSTVPRSGTYMYLATTNVQQSALWVLTNARAVKEFDYINATPVTAA